MTEPEPILYRLGRKSSLWAAFTPGGHGLRRTWQLAVAARNRGGAKVTAPLLETSVLRPLATVILKGEAYPLTIDWHESRRGGQLALGGERKLGTDGGTLAWEMRWLPQVREDKTGEEGAFRVEMRVRTTPRRSGALRIDLASPLYQPELWAIPAVTESGHSAGSAWSAYSAHGVGLVAGDGEAAWNEAGGWTLDFPCFPFGGGKLIAFGLRFGAAKTAAESRAALVTQYAGWAGPILHPLASVTPLDPTEAAQRLTAPDAYDVQGMERLYLKPPTDRDAGSHFAGFPHEPAGALKAFWDWNRLRETPASRAWSASGRAASARTFK